MTNCKDKIIISNFEVDKFVFVKIRRNAEWPAKIIEIEERKGSSVYHVIFYGT